MTGVVVSATLYLQRTKQGLAQNRCSVLVRRRRAERMNDPLRAALVKSLPLGTLVSPVEWQ